MTKQSLTQSISLIAIQVAIFVGTPDDLFAQTFGDQFMVTGRPQGELFQNGESVGSLDAGEMIFIAGVADDFVSCWHLGEKVEIRRRDVTALDMALKAVNETISEPPTASDELLLGIVNARLANNQPALRHLNRAIELDPDNANAWRYRGHVYYRLRDHKKSLDDLQRSLQLEPQNYRTYNFLGNNYFVQEQFKLAKENYQQSIELQPAYYVPLINLATIAYEQEDVEQYRRYLQKAMKLNPADLDSEYYLAYLDYANEDFDEANRKFDLILKKNPVYVPVLAYKARILYRQGNFEDCLKALNRAHEIDRRDDQTNSALALYLSACPDPSIRDGERALPLAQSIVDESNGKYGYGLCLLAAAQSEVGDYESALATLDKCQLATMRALDFEKQIREAVKANRPFRLPAYSTESNNED